MAVIHQSQPIPTLRQPIISSSNQIPFVRWSANGGLGIFRQSVEGWGGLSMWPIVVLPRPIQKVKGTESMSTETLVEAGMGSNDHVSAVCALPGKDGDMVLFARQRLSSERVDSLHKHDVRVYICSESNRECVPLHGNHNMWVHTLTSSHDGRCIASVGHDSVVNLSLELEEGGDGVLSSVALADRSYRSAVFYPGRRTTLVLSIESDLTSELALASWNGGRGVQKIIVPLKNRARIRGLSVSQCGLLVVLTDNFCSLLWWCDPKHVSLRYLNSLPCLESCAHPTEPIVAGEERLGNRFVLVRVDGEKTSLLCASPKRCTHVRCMSWSPSGDRLLVVGHMLLTVYRHNVYRDGSHELQAMHELVPRRERLSSMYLQSNHFSTGGCGFLTKDRIFFIRCRDKQRMEVRRLPPGSVRRAYARAICSPPPLWSAVWKRKVCPDHPHDHLREFFWLYPGLRRLVGGILLRFTLDS